MVKPLVRPADEILYDTLLSTSQEGRGRTPRYRQNQLLFMHGFLRNDVDRIRKALQRDGSTTELQVDVEIGMSLACIRKLYEGINFKKSIKDEFRLARREDNKDARISYGIVLLRPTSHTRFFSIISAAATAIAAGNVILLELENSLKFVDAYFREHFRVYDGEAFAIATSRAVCPRFLESCLVVDQTTAAISAPHFLRHSPNRSVVAVVDKSADLCQAAESVITSRVGFQGTSPNAVDLVLVNEWIREAFIAELEKALRKVSYVVADPARPLQEPVEAPTEETQELYMKVNGVVVSELPRMSKALASKGSNSTLRLVTVTGLVDAVNVASEISPLSVLYCFADPHSSKYLGQYIDSALCVSNHIPTALLVGPSLPEANLAADLSTRYNTIMMSRPAPQLSCAVEKPLADIYHREARPLRAFKQGPGGDIGFFPRSILLGFFVVGLPSLCVLGYGVACMISHFHRN